MSADQMVSALSYNSSDFGVGFDLADQIDRLSEQLAERNFGDIDRTVILRAILANLDEDIYGTDWTRLAENRRNILNEKLHHGVDRTFQSLDLAVEFLHGEGVMASRLLPYSLQLVVLSAAFDSEPMPAAHRLGLLKRWFWVSSFSGWFGGANPSRVNSLVRELRQLEQGASPKTLQNFNLNAKSLPYPSNFDMRSARTRALLLVMLSLRPRASSGELIVDPWIQIVKMGPAGVGHIYENTAKGNPANRMIRPPEASGGLLWRWIFDALQNADDEILYSHGLNSDAIRCMAARDEQGFISVRQGVLISAERGFQEMVSVHPSSNLIGGSQIDTE